MHNVSNRLRRIASIDVARGHNDLCICARHKWVNSLHVRRCQAGIQSATQLRLWSPFLRWTMVNDCPTAIDLHWRRTLQANA